MALGRGESDPVIASCFRRGRGLKEESRTVIVVRVFMDWGKTFLFYTVCKLRWTVKNCDEMRCLISGFLNLCTLWIGSGPFF